MLFFSWLLFLGWSVGSIIAVVPAVVVVGSVVVRGVIVTVVIVAPVTVIGTLVVMIGAADIRRTVIVVPGKFIVEMTAAEERQGGEREEESERFFHGSRERWLLPRTVGSCAIHARFQARKTWMKFRV